VDGESGHRRPGQHRDRLFVRRHAQFRGQRFAARFAGDPLGVLTLHEAVLAEGQAPQINTMRWEDYSQTAIDPTDDCTIWYVGDYLKRMRRLTLRGSGRSGCAIEISEVLMEYRHAVTARIWEPIEPIARGERYEDPLQAALQAAQLGTVDGGGSQLTKLGEVQFAELELHLANLDAAIDLVQRVLEEAGHRKARS